jgi:hypothetical protein
MDQDLGLKLGICQDLGLKLGISSTKILVRARDKGQDLRSGFRSQLGLESAQSLIVV